VYKKKNKITSEGFSSEYIFLLGICERRRRRRRRMENNEEIEKVFLIEKLWFSKVAQQQILSFSTPNTAHCNLFKI
jgi:hypothetical protein